MKPIVMSVIFFKKVTLSVFFFFCNYVLIFCSNEHLRVWVALTAALMMMISAVWSNSDSAATTRICR